MLRHLTAATAVFLCLALGACAGVGGAAMAPEPVAPAPDVQPPPALLPVCTDRKSALANLARIYQEAPVASGVTHNGGLVEVLTPADGATWSIIVTTPQGMSCLVATGEGWRAFDPAPKAPDA